MAYRSKHTIYECIKCEEQFVMRYKELFETFCPMCGSSKHVDIVKDVWMDNPFNHRKRYSPEEDEIIINSIRRGYLVREIEIEGRTRESIYKRAERLKRWGLV